MVCAALSCRDLRARERGSAPGCGTKHEKLFCLGIVVFPNSPLLKFEIKATVLVKIPFSVGNRPDPTCVPSPCRFSCCSAALPPPRCNLFGHSLALAVLNTLVESFARSTC